MILLKGPNRVREDGSPFEFTLTIISDDLDAMLTRPEHLFRTLGTVTAPFLAAATANSYGGRI